MIVNSLRLHEIALTGDLADAIEFFAATSEKIDLNAKNELGQTALFIAAASRNYEVAKYLVEKGANPNLPDISNFTILEYIGQNFRGLEHILHFLLENGANPFVNEGRAISFFESAYPTIYTKIVNTKILHERIKQGDVNGTRECLQRGASLQYIDEQLHNAIEYAREAKNVEILEIIEEHLYYQCNSETDFQNRIQLMLDNSKVIAKNLAVFFKTDNSQVFLENFESLLNDIHVQAFKLFYFNHSELIPIRSFTLLRTNYDCFLCRNELGKVDIVFKERIANNSEIPKTFCLAFDKIETFEPKNEAGPSSSSLMPYNQMLIEFHERIQNALNALNILSEQDYMQHPLYGTLSQIDLIKIYQYILEICNNNTAFSQKPELRLPKNVTGLARTLTVLQDFYGQLYLLLETRMKKIDGEKDEGLIIGDGEFGEVKLIWRIDATHPYQWTNKRFQKNPINDDVRLAEREAFTSNTIITAAKIDSEDASMILKIYAGNNYIGNDEIHKISLYSEYANKRDLCFIIKSGVNFSPNQVLFILKQIIAGIRLCHKYNIIHQDIKSSNILLHEENGELSVLIADFGNAVNVNRLEGELALANKFFDSPEISSAYSDPTRNARMYAYYFAAGLESYGDFIAKELNVDAETSIHYQIPHMANDIWGIGIVAFELFFNRLPGPEFAKDRSTILNHPILSKLLEPERSKRITSNEAFRTNFQVCPSSSSDPQNEFDPNNILDSSSRSCTVAFDHKRQNKIKTLTQRFDRLSVTMSKSDNSNEAMSSSNYICP